MQAHAHEDFPEQDDENWTKPALSWLDKPYGEVAEVALKYRGVVDQPLDEEMQKTNGGTPTDGKTLVLSNAENSIVPGLLAAGETDGASVHDDNRLGANSLLGLEVVGRQATDTTAELVNLDSPAVQRPRKTGEASTARMNKFRLGKGPIPTADLRRARQANSKSLPQCAATVMAGTGAKLGSMR